MSVREQCLHAYHIPATKHVLAIVTTTLRYILFLNMSLVGKREPITAAEWVYILLLLSPLFEEIGQAKDDDPNPNPNSNSNPNPNPKPNPNPNPNPNQRLPSRSAKASD